MIDFTEGKIEIGVGKIRITSTEHDIHALSDKGLIQKGEDETGVYYYFNLIYKNLKFEVSFRFQEKKVDRLVLHWLDGPCTSQGWDGVDEKKLADEFCTLLNFVEKEIGRPPDHKKNRQRTWRMLWGNVAVSYEPRDFIVAIYMKPT